MPIDFVLKRYPGCRAATITRKGPWKKENLRAEFRALVAWARKNRVRPGRWFFIEGGGMNRWIAALEFRGKAKGSGPIRVRTLPTEWVASVVCDPDELAPRVVYHGLSDWLRWRRKDRTIRRVAYSREVYSADPWTHPAAWSRAEVQFVVRK